MFTVVYRGGADLAPKPFEVRVDRQTGLIKPIRGISVHTDPARVAKFGGAYQVDSIPEGLKLQQTGRDPGHYEIMPAHDMTMDEYVALLAQITLTLVQP